MAAPQRLEWTQPPGIGPGAEILGGDLSDRRIVELGCGAGRNSAHLAAAGAIVTGVDRSAGQIRRARAHYGHTGARFVRAGATLHLTRSATRLDAIVSVFGAIGTTDPSQILALCSRRLARRGVLAFAVAHPHRTGALPATARTLTEVTLPNGTTGSVQHWDIDPGAWARALNRAGLLVTGTQDLFAPADAPWPTTLLITARKP
ncbi:class I SAM-dependent methyltransferase [Streptomyces sp. NPDC088194]|uniref:class I SAM-dependent methyltransferase n=1 Tax=Streptomyces sp. NPDC088194 TaxID=3154931 RepID=UPI00344FC4C9